MQLKQPRWLFLYIKTVLWTKFGRGLRNESVKKYSDNKV